MTIPNKIESDSRKLLGRLRDTMAEEAKGQDRLDKITKLIASTTGTEVCSIYLLRDSETLELCATEGLEIDAVHQTRMRIGEGLVGKVAKRNKAIKEDKYLNALQIKYAYAITCHKSQGGQWKSVFVDQSYFTDEMLNKEYLRWFCFDTRKFI